MKTEATYFLIFPYIVHAEHNNKYQHHIGTIHIMSIVSFKAHNLVSLIAVRNGV